MSLESLYYQILKFEELEEKYKRLYKLFDERICNELIELTFKHAPILLEDRVENERKLREVTTKYASSIFDDYDGTLSMQSAKKEVTYSKFKKPITKEEGEIELQRILASFPEEMRAGYDEIYWETFTFRQEQELFIDAVYVKTKEICVDVYFDNIMKLDSKYLLNFDWKIHLDASDFVYQIYEMLPRRR